MKKILLLFICIGMLCTCQACVRTGHKGHHDHSECISDEKRDSTKVSVDEAPTAPGSGASLRVSRDVPKVDDSKAPKAPDFTLEDINGNSFSLSSLKGKFVVVDFWGSWCYWCMKGMPEMKNYYDKYKGILEIVGVNCGDSKAKWKTTVEEKGLSWINVCCPDNSRVLGDYDISGFPTKIFISPNGKILNTVCGENPSFYKFIDDTLSK